MIQHSTCVVGSWLPGEFKNQGVWKICTERTMAALWSSPQHNTGLYLLPWKSSSNRKLCWNELLLWWYRTRQEYAILFYCVLMQLYIGYYRGVWTVKDCIPYVHSYLSTYPTANYHRTTYVTNIGHVFWSLWLYRFYDLTAGISDPNVFDPPPECLW